MADQTLQVKIEGDLKNLQAALTQAKKNLKQFGTDADVAGEQLERSFDGATQATNRLDNAEKRLANTTKGLKTSIGSANGVAIEFNRIIQDAPFGVIGIGNNIQQLTANFAQLRAQSPSTGKAIVAALTSLVSPANLVVLGISAVTAAFTAYQMGAFDSTEETKSLTDALEDLDKEIKSTVDSLRGLERVSFESSSGIEKERLRVESLFQILEDTNNTQLARIGAYNELIEKYPQVLRGLTQEKALAGGLTLEYQKLIKVIEAKAFAAALDEELRESFKDQLSVQKQYNSEVGKEIDLQRQLQNIRFKIRSEEQTGGAKGLIAGLRSQEKELIRNLELQRQVVSLTERLYDAQGVEAENLKSQLFAVNQELAQYSDAIETTSDDTKKWNATLEQTNFLIGLQNDLMKRASQELPKLYEQIIEGFNGGGIIQVALPPIDASEFKESLSEADQAFIDFEIAFYQNLGRFTENFENSVKSLTLNFLVDSITESMSAIGEALTAGSENVKSVGEVLLSGISGFLKQLGKEMVAYGTAALAMAILTKALLNPITAVPAAIGLIAAGAALSFAGGAIKGTLSEGASAGVSSSSYGSSSQAYSGTGAQAINLEFGEFEIRGTKLVGVIKATEKKQARG